MKLSDAIRKGSEQTEQAFKALVVNNGRRIAACALGAAWIGMFGWPSSSRRNNTDEQLGDLEEHFPELSRVTGAPCGCCGWQHSTTGAIILHLNDCHRWPREAIADWLDTLDRIAQLASEALRVQHESVLLGV